MEPIPAAQVRRPTSREFRGMVIVALAILIAGGYFFTGGGWNQASHFDLTRAMVERRTIRIDEYHENTGDKSYFQGHYYCNKAPGLAILSVPFIAVTRECARLGAFNLTDERVLLWEARSATFACATLPTAATAIALCVLATSLGASFRAGCFCALVFAFGTPALAYSTFLWTHALVAAFLSIAFAAVVALNNPASGKRVLGLAIVVGFSCGWALATEVQSAGAALILAGLALWGGRKAEKSRIRNLVVGLLAGTSVPILVLGCYNLLAFGSPFRLSYTFVTGFPGHAEGFLGVTYPKFNVLLELFFGFRRGLLWFAPLLLAAPAGVILLLKDRKYRAIAAGVTGVFAYYLFLNASFHYWMGGWCYGPRYLFPGMGILSLGLAPLFDSIPRRFQFMAWICAGASSLSTLAGVSTNPMPPETLMAPHGELLYPSFLKGKLSLNQEPYFSATPTPSFNLGELFGLTGNASLIPLFVILLLLFAAFVWNETHARQSASAGEVPQPSLEQGTK
jgi:hypothetical protein